MAIPSPSSSADSPEIPGVSPTGTGNNRVNSAVTMAASDSNGEDTVTVHEVDTYKYAPEWVPDRTFRVSNAAAPKEQDPGTK